MQKRGYLTANGVYYAAFKAVNATDTEIPLKPGDNYWWDTNAKEWKPERRSAASIEAPKATAPVNTPHVPTQVVVEKSDEGISFTLKEMVPIIVSSGVLLSSIFGVYTALTNQILSIEKDLGYAQQKIQSLSDTTDALSNTNSQLKMQLNELTGLVVSSSRERGPYLPNKLSKEDPVP